MAFSPLQDLIADLNSELSGNFRDVVLGLMMTPAEYDASEVYKAIKVPGLTFILSADLIVSLSFTLCLSLSLGTPPSPLSPSFPSLPHSSPLLPLSLSSYPSPHSSLPPSPLPSSPIPLLPPSLPPPPSSQGLGTDESTLIEILCTRTNEEISLLRTQYKSGKQLT